MITSTTSIFIRSLTALVILCAMAALTAQPAAAQTAKKLQCKGCVKSKQLKNNGIRSKDIKDGQVGGADMRSDISIGTASNDGDLSVKSAAGTPGVSLDGDTGNVTNSLAGNGLAKAWALIDTDGTVVSCYRCNLDPAETQNLSEGVYEVDFTPLGTDVRGRPRLCSPGGLDSSDNTCSTRDSGDLSSVLVQITDVPQVFANIQGKPQNGPFTLVIF